ncbi:MAG TPA: DUF998 domain-containing protein [Acidimicrobiales bacterium]
MDSGGGSTNRLSTTRADGPPSSLGIFAPWRRPAAIGLGVVWLTLYNWWIPVAISGKLMNSPNELFSDLEATGRPDATLLQHLDLAAGLVLIVALVLRGSQARGGRRSEWPWLMAMAVSGAIGGQFSYACPEGLSASCGAAEWRLALPHHHYVHVLAGIAEFVFATVAVYLAWKRTRPNRSAVTTTVRWIGRVMVLAYPFLGIAYLTDRFGAFVEPVFFTCFSVMVAVELLEADRQVAGATVGVVRQARQVLHRVLPNG